MRLSPFSLLALVPLISGFQFPHITPQSALSAADSLLGSNTASNTLTTASDISLASVKGDEHFVITSARHPNHRVRIKSTTGWCDPDVKSYSGYLDVGDGKDLFFYFFESRSNPKEDPVVMWINGGPGCSSSLGLFMELGPCSVKENPKTLNDTKVNPYSWNQKANIFFLDEPIGVGFSLAEHGQQVKTTEEAALDIQAFVQIFFETFKEFEGRAFHLSGESYGGRYLPVFASAVYDGNAALIKEGKTPINIQSILIGNGITDYVRMTESYYPFQCTIHGGLNQTVQPISTCVQLAQAVPKCDKFYRKHCEETHDYTLCSMAMAYCEETLGESFLLAERNPYDVSKPCSPQELSDSLCYSVTDRIGHYLDLPDVRSLLGVDKSRGNFSSCDGTVFTNFNFALDNTGQTWLYVSGLLERGIRVLSYVGTFDFICNHIGNEAWLEALEWSGKKGYNEAELTAWKVKGKVAGSYKTWGNLSHLKIVGAGHMVPYDKPVEALTMLESWLGETSFSE